MSHKTKKEDLPVYEVLKDIKDGSLNPALLSRDTSELCVELLVSEGYGSGQIASLLKKSDRTIRRIIADVRQKNALIASPELMSIIVGDLLVTSRNQSARLKQLARSADASPIDKARVEFLSWKVNKEVVDKLYQIGYFTPGQTLRTPQDPPELKSGMSEEDLAIQKVYSNMAPMEKEQLAEKLRQDILRLAGEEETPE